MGMFPPRPRCFPGSTTLRHMSGRIHIGVHGLRLAFRLLVATHFQYVSSGRKGEDRICHRGTKLARDRADLGRLQVLPPSVER